MNAAYQFGIEEEYFLADAATRGTPRRAVHAFHRAVNARHPDIGRELLVSQVEVASTPSTSFADARGQLADARADLAKIGRDHDILVLAAGTHPLARWSRQGHTEKDRYKALLNEMQMLGRRNLCCGMHVHVETPNPGARVDLMNRLLPFMPLLLALSSSSPFWQGRNTGLAGYRMSAFCEMPRTGLPDLFRDTEDYDRYVAAMIGAGAIKDASYLWWTLRPSVKYPTLELRVADSCTALSHSLAIAALYRCLVRLAVRTPHLNAGLTGAARAIVSENLWRAQRDGRGAVFLDHAGGEPIALTERLDQVLGQIADDADALGCSEEAMQARGIAERGTSSDHQLKAFNDGMAETGDRTASLAKVVDWLAAATNQAP